jgi:hypothetical protein
MVHQRVWFDKAFMHLLVQHATLRSIASASVLWWSQQQVFLNVKRANRFFLSAYQMGQQGFTAVFDRLSIEVTAAINFSNG